MKVSLTKFIFSISPSNLFIKFVISTGKTADTPPEVWHGCPKGISFSKGWFSGSMLNFRGVKDRPLYAGLFINGDLLCGLASEGRSSSQGSMKTKTTGGRCRKLGLYLGLVPSLKLTVRTWKWMVGRLISFWGPAYFQGQAVSFRECKV